MFRTITPAKKAFITAVVISSVCALLLTGCGNNSSDTGTAYTPSTSAPTPKVPAAGPAISDKLKFDQLALESPVKTVTSKDGLVFLEFQYADRDGKVYKCKLPKAMSIGEFPPDQWVRTFNIYKLPEVIKQKNVVDKNGQPVNDFPFIAPKPRTVPSQDSTSGTPAAPPMPPAP
ncbi:MAG: hypothetical protein ACYC64_04495 [Armatimonadota bacterium]